MNTPVSLKIHPLKNVDWPLLIANYDNSYVSFRGTSSHSAQSTLTAQDTRTITSFLENGFSADGIAATARLSHVLAVIGRFGGEHLAMLVIEKFPLIDTEFDQIAAIDCVAAIGGYRVLRFLREIGYSEFSSGRIREVAQEVIDELVAECYDMMLGPPSISKAQVDRMLLEAKETEEVPHIKHAAHWQLNSVQETQHAISTLSSLGNEFVQNLRDLASEEPKRE
jgi:hypothetical protein